MAGPRIVVVGSANTDMSMFVEQLPGKGQTVLGKRFTQSRGGKGANQAVAAARLGARVSFIGRVGDDVLGEQARSALQAEQVDTEFLSTDPELHSGVALIFVDEKGENTIGVAPGANNGLNPAEVRRAEQAVAEADYLLIQLEIPMDTVLEAVRTAAEHNVPVLLNPAPAPVTPLPDELLANSRVVVPNAEELKSLAGESETQQAINELLSSGPEAVVVTRGAEGVLLGQSGALEQLPAFNVEPKDTVGAGDCFCAALAVALAEERPVHAACRFAAAAAALSVQSEGAQSGMPQRQNVDAFLKSHPSGEDSEC